MNATPASRGLTLIELLVAMTIFLVLGGALVMFLRVGLDTWRTGEIRREAFERSQAILDQVSDDLAATYSDPTHGTGGFVDVVFLSDYDANGRQRLRLVRSLAGEMRHPITQRAGSLTSGRMDYDYEDDAVESEMGFLRAPGGLQEVAYVMDPNPDNFMLWRGVKSPIGFENTLFDDENLYELEPFDGTGVEGSTNGATTPGAVADGASPPMRLRRCRPFADGVLYLEFNFWGQETNTWSDLGAGNRAGRAQASWDSTRAILDGPGAADGSRHEWRDDVFPSRVQIVLVLRPARATRFARLRTKVGTGDTEISVDTTQHYPDGSFQYILVGKEWMRYVSKSDRRFSEVERGARGTQPTEHAAGTPVIYGTTFSRVVRIPTARRSNWKSPR